MDPNTHHPSVTKAWYMCVLLLCAVELHCCTKTNTMGHAVTIGDIFLDFNE